MTWITSCRTLGLCSLLCLGLAISPPLAKAQQKSITAAKDALDGQAVLRDYNAALEALPALPNLQFRQQVRVSGSQEFTATLDVLLRKDGSWQSWLAEGDKVRLLDSKDLNIINQSDLLQLYSVYVSKPETLLPKVGLNFAAPPSRYTVVEAKSELLDGKPVNRLKLSGEGQLQELWLDPKTSLPQQALFYLSGVWGKAYALVGFTTLEQKIGNKTERYWLPAAAQINLGYGFWALSGLSRRDFQGSLTIKHEYQDYQVLPEGSALRFLPNQPPLDNRPVIAGLPNSSSQVQVSDVKSLGKNAQGQEEFSIGIRNQGSAAPTSKPEVLGDRITAFNLTKPSTRNPLVQFDTLAVMALGKGNLPIYLFQFDIKEPIAPIQAPAGGGKSDPNNLFDLTAPAIRLLGE